MDAALQISLLWLLFVGSHLFLSHPPVRSRLLTRLGAGGFSGLYSVVALAIFTPLVATWWGARHQGPMLWMLRGLPGATRAAELLVVFGYGLAVASLVQPGPGSIQVAMSGRAPEARGVATITRHPMFVGLSLWATAHIAMNGWASDIVFFAGFPLITLLGGLHQDWRKAKENPAFREVLRTTSFVPFVSALRGHPVRLGGRGWLALGIGAGSAILLRVFHTRLFS